MFFIDDWFYKFLSELAKTPRDLNPELAIAMFDLKIGLCWDVCFKGKSYF